MIRRRSDETIARNLLALILICAAAVSPARAEHVSTQATIRFIGATGEISGSCHLLDTGYERILLDCGSFMESDGSRDDAFSFPPVSVNLVVLSHAHLDHTGRLPALYAQGYTGLVLCARPTRSIAEVMLPMQDRIKTGTSGSATQRILTNFWEIPFATPRRLATGTEIELLPAGHILGSAMIIVRYGPPEQRRTLVFSGDFGNDNCGILQPKPTVTAADTVIVESTYGDRSHVGCADEMERFYNVLRQTADDNAVAIIPSFVLARTQKVLAFLHRGIRTGRLPDNLNIYVSSQSAVELTKLYRANDGQLRDEYREGLRPDSSPFSFANLHLTGSNGRLSRPAVIIAPSGDASIGPAAQIIAEYVGDPTTRICFVSSYQTPGSPGDALTSGAQRIEIGGKAFWVQGKVYEFGGFSDHGDQPQILEWLSHISGVRQVFTVHGAPAAARALAESITQRMGWPAEAVTSEKLYVLP